MGDTLEDRVANLAERLQVVETQLETMQEALTKLDLFNVNENNGSLLFSQVDYEKLTDEQKNNGKIYLIKD
ncbi:hypothetical protein HW053_001478 [Campylobacter jejuni]|uniref:hypothetical protein n=1 Tax=Campylobacter jejuni TaxID=197 RepID=UPI00073DD912|nr:hypothetical protein [Campylobacter jejuni]ALW15614.1 hypothetical protein RC26_02675 [Campylobacter jejuni]EFS7927396.1 hypothetical protein [Campylobacter jejuni]MBX1020860.1 hypothetical protein [Campylobacter jejuni]HED5364337.1 hypothetical protein [Campylobacter jejuni]HEG5317650.1 hypothetical protein [Campylobacter jejuni]